MFLSTPPSRVATEKRVQSVAKLACLSTPPSRVATLFAGCPLFSLHRVSIHATLAGGDNETAVCNPPIRCFYPRHPRGWRRCRIARCRPSTTFLSTPPSRVATLRGGHAARWIVFLSTPPSRVATICTCRNLSRTHCFYPRHPRGWRHRFLSTSYNDFKFLSTPPSRVATCRARSSAMTVSVSIHATLAGGDPQCHAAVFRKVGFLSTPPSRVATLSSCNHLSAEKFLSTPPSRVATRTCWAMAFRLPFLSTPPSRVATPGFRHLFTPLSVSIHATLAGGDSGRHCPCEHGKVSIHATLAGGDPITVAARPCTLCFYPRHPRGWRPAPARRSRPPRQCFYPRHPRGWRRFFALEMCYSPSVSIHATLAGGDGLILKQEENTNEFLSTPPSRVATRYAQIDVMQPDVSIHATLAGGDNSGKGRFEWEEVFLSTPPSRVATFGHQRNVLVHGSFYPRHPRGWRRQKCTKMYSVFCAKGKKLSVKSKII